MTMFDKLIHTICDQNHYRCSSNVALEITKQLFNNSVSSDNKVDDFIKRYYKILNKVILSDKIEE